MKSILDKTFHYTPSSQTDLAKKFAKIWMDLRKAAGVSPARSGDFFPMTQDATKNKSDALHT